MPRKWLIVSAAVLAAAAGGGVWYYAKRRAPEPRQVAVTPAPTKPDEISVSGKIHALNPVEVPAPVDGYIDEFMADVGEEVAEGQLLARLKNTTLESHFESATQDLERAQARVQRGESGIIQARLEASRARADASRARLEADRLEKLFLRQQLLHREGATPRLAFEKAKKEHEAAKAESDGLELIAAQSEDRVSALNKELDAAKKLLDEKTQELELARADLAATEVHAPVDGLIVARRGEPGQEVTREMKDMFQIAVDISVLLVTAEAPPDIAKFLRPALPAAVQVVEAGSDLMPGEVKEVTDTHLTVEFRSPTPAVKPGLNAQVRIRLE